MTIFPETQSSLLVQIKSRDNREAWEQFIAIYRPVIYRIARRRGFQEADAEDVTQKVLSSIANSIHRWQKADEMIRFRHWLRRVVRNAIINAATRGPQEVNLGAIVEIDELFVSEVTPDVKREIELEYRRQVFRQAAAIVNADVEPPTWRAFEMTVIEGLSVEMAADSLHKSVGTVYAARSRVMRRLKEAVKRIEESS